MGGGVKQQPGKAAMGLILGLLSAGLTATVFYFTVEGYPLVALIAMASPFAIVIFLTLRGATLMHRSRSERPN